MHPLSPPLAFPHTPAVAPQKKCTTAPGRIIATLNPACPMKAKTAKPIIPPIKEVKKPINTAFGAYGNKIGQSKAGFALGTSFSEIPLNAGTISAINIRTPDNTT